MRRLEAQAIDAAQFKPFGQLVDPGSRAPEPINVGTTLRHSDLATLDVRQADRDPVLAIYVAQARRFPLWIEKLERHAQAAQLFLPLGWHRFVVVVAPGGEVPEWERMRAFVTRAGQGVCLHRGCWHHGLIALSDGDRFAVVEGGNYRIDTAELAVPSATELVKPA
jgi:ureidoglycolate lyase